VNGRPTISQGQGRDREVWSGGSRRQSREPTDRNRIEGRASGASGHLIAKPRDPGGTHRTLRRPAAARQGATSGVIGQESAEVIVPVPGVEARDGEGPNIVEQGGAVTDSGNAENLHGGAPPVRPDTQPPLGADLMERVVERSNMCAAWKRVKQNRGAPGVDAMSIEDFTPWAHEQWAATRQALLDGRYRPSPVRRVYIPKRSGGRRPLGIPTVVDRVIQQAVLQVLTPIFDPGFSASSFGFRPGRCAHGAIRQVKRYIREGYRYAVDLDLEKFFDRVNHDVLMVRVARKVRDKRILRLIGRYLRAGVEEDGTVQPTREGTPQGGPLSPLLANILLDDLDKELEKRGHRFARYADDLLILVRSQAAGERVRVSITKWLRKHLKLEVNEPKSRVGPTDGTGFLGFTFHGTKVRWSEDAFEDFKYRVRRLTNRSWGVSMQYRLHKLAQYVRGWMNYFGISEYYSPVPEIDGWLRRRIRMCYWKQWRRTGTRVRQLLKLGTRKRQALLVAISAKGPWHLARTMATQTGMTNQWLRQQGLISIRDLWIALAPQR